MNFRSLRYPTLILSISIGTLTFFSNSIFSSSVLAQTTLEKPAEKAAEQKDADKKQASWRTLNPDVVYGHKSGMALTYDVIRPTKNANGAAVVFMVSGGWVSRWFPPEAVVKEVPTDPKNLWEKLVDGGYTLFMVRHGSSPKFKVPEAVDDVRNAIKHIRKNAKEFGVDKNRIGVCGGSAGGHLSLMLGTTGKRTTKVKAVAAYFPPTDLRDIVNDENIKESFPALVFDKELADDVSPLLHVTSDDAPTLLIHGDKDQLVPLYHSEKIVKKFEEAKVQHKLIVLKGAAHGFAGEQAQQAETAVLKWFDEKLKKEE